jgi:hypothetical protein
LPDALLPALELPALRAAAAHDELITAAAIHDHAARLQSYALLGHGRLRRDTATE